MRITCPNCRVPLELPDGLPDNQHLNCPNCNKTFTLRSGITPLAPGVGVVRNVGASMKIKIPKLTLAAFIIFYALLGLGIIGSLGELPDGIPGILGCLTCTAFTLVSHYGKNWARITLTSLIGAGMLISLGENPGLAFFAMLMFATPIVFLWLPCSNRWFKEMKAAFQKQMR